jgi:hypothetical protein
MSLFYNVIVFPSLSNVNIFLTCKVLHPVLRIRICVDPHHYGKLDPDKDPHQSEKQDPVPDPHQSGPFRALEDPNLEQGSGGIRIRIRINLKGRIRTWIRIRVKGKVRIRIKVKSRIRIHYPNQGDADPQHWF